MRTAIALAGVLTALGPAAASAAVVTDFIGVHRSGPAFFADVGVALPAFNAALGTLTGETLTMTGTFTPGEAWAGSPTPLAAPVPVTLTGQVGVLVPPFVPLTSLPTENALAGLDGEAFGTPEAFTVSGALDAADLGTTDWDVWAATIGKPGSFGDGNLATADLGTLSATLLVAYSYTPADPPGDPAGVPEPASLALLGLGVLGLAGVRRA